MDKKILILKNDRVGDFFHSLRNIEHLRNHFSEHITDIYLSEIPENTFYDQSNTSILKYSTKALNATGGINDVKINFAFYL